MDKQEFTSLMKPVIDAIAGKPIDQGLARELDRLFPPRGETFTAIEAACHAAIEAGWMCSRGAPGRRFGRVIEPGPVDGEGPPNVAASDVEDEKEFDFNAEMRETRKRVDELLGEGKIEEVNDRMVDKRIEFMKGLPEFPMNPGWISRAKRFRIGPEQP